MNEAAEKIVAEARSWVGTPFHHGANLKGVGVDCGQLVFGVYRNVGLLADEVFPSYDPRWMMARENTFLEDLFRARFDPIERSEPGAAILFRAGRNYCHLGIVTSVEPLAIVHAASEYGFVIEEEAARVARILRHLDDALLGFPKGARQ
jgi:cell wall-associated NlpC family hydrolase